MKLGARILKTGIAIALAYYICDIFNPAGATIATIAAALAIQPSVVRSWHYGVEQIEANIIGAFLAFIVTYTMGNEPIIIALTVMLVIAINIQLKLEQTIPLAIVTVLIIMESTSDNFFMFALNRFSLMIVGVLSSIVVNALFFPPKYEDRIVNMIEKLRESMNVLFRIILDADTDDRTTRDELKEMTKQLEEINRLFEFHQEERSLFKKNSYTAQRHKVVLRTMIETATVGLRSLKTIGNHSIALTRNQHPLLHSLTQQLDALATYQEKVYLKYKGRIKPQHPHKREEEVSLSSAELVKAAFENSSDSPGERWDEIIDMLPVVAMIHEYWEQLDHLDKMIDSYLTHHQDDN